LTAQPEAPASTKAGASGWAVNIDFESGTKILIPPDPVVASFDRIRSSRSREPEFPSESDTDSSVGTIIGCGRTGTSRN
jgi:hypothetical protein